MVSHFFLMSGNISQERLSWIEECLKYYFVKLNPENLLHRAASQEGVFTFLLTGDALYSLHEPQTARVWEILLALPSVRIICDRQELALRGISVEGLKMKYPDQLIDHNRLGISGQPSFWNDVAKLARQHEQPVPSTIGYLQTESPYMHRSAHSLTSCLTAVLNAHASVELYAYLDGIHCGHAGQNPVDADNIGEALEKVSEKAVKRGLSFQVFACSRCATARGYSTFSDGSGFVISACTIRPFRIRTMNEIAGQFSHSQIILAPDSASIQIRREGPAGSFPLQETSRSPPVIILVTSTPYATERAPGALTLAAALAAAGILTRVIFIEDGIYALTGTQVPETDSRLFGLQEMINAIAGSANLELYAFQPSLHQRGQLKNQKLNAVLDIGNAELGQMLFDSPRGAQAGHKRVIFF